jgi:Rrf2 family transcriptional regulator, cysteine metabolism repressor
MRITTQGEYGLRCLLYIASQKQNKPISIAEISEYEKLPRDYVEQLLLKLRRGNIIKSIRGVQGGYLLAQKPRDITIFTVIKTLEQGTFEVICVREMKKGCVHQQKGHCRIRPLWEKFKDHVDTFLKSYTLHDIMQMI